MNEFRRLIAEIVAFRDERDWKQFHAPRHLAAALAIEAAELQEQFLWKEDSEIKALLATPDGHAAVTEEIADVLIFALLLCEAVDIDPEPAVRAKLEINARKYPADLARSKATKYTELHRADDDPGMTPG